MRDPMERSQRLTDGTRWRTFMRLLRLEDLMASYTNAGAPELAHAGLQLKHQKGTAEVGVARGLRHGCTVTKGVHELRVRNETRRSPTVEAPEGAAHVGVEREQLLFAVFPAHAHAVGRVEAEDTRLHGAHCRQ